MSLALRIMACVNSTNPPVASNAHLGTLLRDWRVTRRLSQLDLALEAGVSTRHLSCVETGKANPSREMLGRLAEALDIPLRDRNSLLVAAGFAPTYRETALATPEMAPVRQAIEFILEHHEPFPAIVTNRYWDVLLVNKALVDVFRALKPSPPKHDNVVRQIFDPDDVRGVILNWEEVAGDMIRHVHNEVAASPNDPKIRGLLDEVLAYPGVPARWRVRQPGAATAPLLTAELGNGELRLRFFSTLTTFGTPHDVTLDELRIESMFPADEATARVCRSLAAV